MGGDDAPFYMAEKMLMDSKGTGSELEIDKATRKKGGKKRGKVADVVFLFSL